MTFEELINKTECKLGYYKGFGWVNWMKLRPALKRKEKEAIEFYKEFLEYQRKLNES